jgi:hypothetical protein
MIIHFFPKQTAQTCLITIVTITNLQRRQLTVGEQFPI